MCAAGTILIGWFSDTVKVGRIWIRWRHRQAHVSSRIGLRPHRSWPRFARCSEVNRACALQATFDTKSTTNRPSTGTAELLWKCVCVCVCVCVCGGGGGWLVTQSGGLKNLPMWALIYEAQGFCPFKHIQRWIFLLKISVGFSLQIWELEQTNLYYLILVGIARAS